MLIVIFTQTQKLFKFALLAMNLVFVIFGAVLMSAGSYAQSHQFAVLSGETLPRGLVVLGAFIAVLAFLGGLSAWREARAFLIVYFVLLSLITIILLGVGAAVYAKRDDAPKYIVQGWTAANNDIRVDVQNFYICCGLNTYNDSLAGQPCPVTNSTIAPPPCLDLIVNTFYSSLSSAGSVGIAFSIVMIVALAGIMWLIVGIKVCFPYHSPLSFLSIVCSASNRRSNSENSAMRSLVANQPLQASSKTKFPFAPPLVSTHEELRLGQYLFVRQLKHQFS